MLLELDPYQQVKNRISQNHISPLFFMQTQQCIANAIQNLQGSLRALVSWRQFVTKTVRQRRRRVPQTADDLQKAQTHLQVPHKNERFALISETCSNEPQQIISSRRKNRGLNAAKFGEARGARLP